LHFFVVVALLGAECAAFAIAGVADYDFGAHFWGWMVVGFGYGLVVIVWEVLLV